MSNVALKLPWHLFHADEEASLIATPLLGLVSCHTRPQGETIKYIFQYRQDDKSSLRKLKKRISININHSY